MIHQRRHSSIKLLSLAGSLFLSLGLWGCGSGSSGPAAPTGPIQLVPGVAVGRMIFGNGDTSTGAQGLPVDGISPGLENLTYHIHAHLSLFNYGDQVAIPQSIGIINSGASFYTLHTHESSGIIHVEAPAPGTYTLGQFFDIWGQPLTSANVAGLMGTVTIYINGNLYTGDLASIPLTAHEQITLEVGTPLVTPPTYIFPPNY